MTNLLLYQEKNGQVLYIDVNDRMVVDFKTGKDTFDLYFEADGITKNMAENPSNIGFTLSSYFHTNGIPFYLPKENRGSSD
jgi:hypothetical protein